MSKNTVSKDTSSDPALIHIDRNIVFGFSALILLMMILVLVAGGILFHRVSQNNANELQEIMTGILADSIDRVSFSGKYHARLLVEQIAKSQPRIVYVLIADMQGKIIAHSLPSKNEKPLPPESMALAKRVHEEHHALISETSFHEQSIKLVAMPYRSGYQGKDIGTIIVAISTEEVRTAFLSVWGYLAVLLLILFVLSLGATYLLGKRFAGPVKSLAWKMKGVLEHTPLLIHIADRQTNSHTSSASFERMPSDASGLLESQLQRTFVENKVINEELTQNIAGIQRTFMSTGFPILKDTRQETQIACCMALDVTDRKRAEESLRRSETNLQITLDSIGDAVIATDASWRIVRMNPVAQRLTGYSLAQAEGRNLSEVFQIYDPSTEQRVQTPSEHVTAPDKPADIISQALLIARDGTKRQIANSSAPIRDEDGKIMGMVLVFRDITEELALQDQLRQAHKMEAIGQLAGGVAHDFNNLLTGILGNSQLLLMELKDSSEHATYTKEIISAASRAADLTRQLLDFSRKGRFRITDIDIHDLVNEVVRLLSRSIDKRIHIQQHLDAACSTVHGDPSQLQNTILNLAVNARDAMPTGGNLTFTTRNTTVDEEYAQAHSSNIVPGQYIAISVSDTGVGMDDELQKHIFEPFFTTKKAGEGTGLGLASVYGCVRSHDGLIQVSSQVEKGSTFTILLPLVESAPQVETTPVSKPIPGKGQVLIIDDEEIIRNLASKALRALGYTVWTCSDGIQGVEFFSEKHQEIDLVILDLIMPKMSGEDTFARIREIDPDAHVLIASGFSQTKTVNNLLRQGALGFLGKPFSITELSREVSQHLRKDNSH